MKLHCFFSAACDYWIGILKIGFLATKYFRAEHKLEWFIYIKKQKNKPIIINM